MTGPVAPSICCAGHCGLPFDCADTGVLFSLALLRGNSENRRDCLLPGFAESMSLLFREKPKERRGDSPDGREGVVSSKSCRILVGGCDRSVFVGFDRRLMLLARLRILSERLPRVEDRRCPRVGLWLWSEFKDGGLIDVRSFGVIGSPLLGGADICP